MTRDDGGATARHTPPPWCVEDDDWFADFPFIPITVGQKGAEDYRKICEILGGGKPESDDEITDEDRANARLIAATPDLYELLREFIDTAGNPPADLPIRAAALLARIEGGEP